MTNIAILPYCPCTFCLHMGKGHLQIHDNFYSNLLSSTDPTTIALTILIWSNCSTFSDVVKVLEDGDLQTLGLLDYDKRLKHSFTAHPKVDPFTDEMFTFGYSHEPPYCTYRVITKDGAMLDPVPITIPESVMMHDFAITENYSIFMDLPLLFRPKEMVKNGEFIYKFDPTKKSRFGILPRYAKDDKLIRWFELPNCFIFHNANAWEEGDEVVLITCRLENPDLDKVNGHQSDKLENFGNELCVPAI